MYGIIEINGGIGKNIMATAVIKNIKLKYPELQLLVITAYPEVFLYNSDVYRIFKYGSCPYFYDDYVKNNKCVFFCDEPYRTGKYLSQSGHLIEAWCDAIKIPCVTGEMQVLINTRELSSVKERIKVDKPILIFQPFGGSGDLMYNWNRDIPLKQAQLIVQELSSKYEIIQFYKGNQQKLSGCTHINWPLRELFALVMLSDKVLSIDSFVQHFCAAIHKPATVCWITNNPTIFGYNIHKNIFNRKDIMLQQENINIDSYFHKYDFTGSRNYDFPFVSEDIFDISNIISSI